MDDRKFKLIQVSLDDSPTFTAYTDGSTWNGWECPHFTKENVQAVVNQHNEACNGDDELKLVWDGENIIQTFAEYEDEQDITEPHEIELENGDKIKVWALGAWSWCWSETNQLIN